MKHKQTLAFYTKRYGRARALAGFLDPSGRLKFYTEVGQREAEECCPCLTVAVPIPGPGGRPVGVLGADLAGNGRREGAR
ncbi:MAG: PDC sensor domain-containing protein [Desulfotomaculales bacterium]